LNDMDPHVCDVSQSFPRHMHGTSH
jgi:hypothetical protein